MFAFLNLPKPRCVTCLLIQIYCPTFFSGEWVVICFVLPKINVLPISRPQIHVLCRNKSFKDVSCFCYSLGDELNAAFKRCNYRERDFLLKIARTSSTIEPDGSAFACMYFMEQFQGSEETCLNRLAWKEKEVC